MGVCHKDMHANKSCHEAQKQLHTRLGGIQKPSSDILFAEEFHYLHSDQVRSDQSLSRVQLFATP